jgi:hypothetical protein
MTTQATQEETAKLRGFRIATREARKALQWIQGATTEETGAFDLRGILVDGQLVATDGRQIRAVQRDYAAIMPGELPDGYYQVSPVKLNSETATAGSVGERWGTS